MIMDIEHIAQGGVRLQADSSRHGLTTTECSCGGLCMTLLGSALHAFTLPL